MDAELVKRAGMPIKDLVAQHGWPHFRDLEQALCEELCKRDRVIIDCGGGVIERAANIAALRGTGTVFWLRAKPETIIKRIGADDQRPSLTGTKSFTDEVIEVLERRAPLYARAAHVQIDTDGDAPEAIAKRIFYLFPLVRD
jgi:shikimate kinase